MCSEHALRTVLFKIKDGVDLDKVSAGQGDASAVKAFTTITDLIKGGKGYTNHYWGTSLDDPTIKICVVECESLEGIDAFENAPEYKTVFVPALGEIFDIQTTSPLKINAQFTSDTTSSFKAELTELAYFSLPPDAGEADKAAIEKAYVPILEAATLAGAAVGSAAVADPVEHPAAVNFGTTTCNGIIGYKSVEAQDQFRASPKIAEVGKAMMSLAQEKGLQPATLFGQHVFSAKFHAAS